MGKAKDRIEAMIRFHKNRHESCLDVVGFDAVTCPRDLDTYHRMCRLEARYHIGMIDILEGYDLDEEPDEEEVVFTQLSPTGSKGKKPKPKKLDTTP